MSSEVYIKFILDIIGLAYILSTYSPPYDTLMSAKVSKLIFLHKGVTSGRQKNRDR